MDKLTTEQKAKRYDEAIEKLRSLHDDYDTVSTLIDIKEELENIFSELKESEDERIRKGIIRNLEYLMNRAEGFVKDELKKRIAWLEKQGQTFTKKDVDYAYLTGVYDAKQELEKQGEKKVSYITTVETGDGGINALVTRDIEIPYGAKDSELQEVSYYIPEGYYAHIDDDKVIIKRRGKSKFNVGDWIISNNKKSTYQVKEVKRGIYVIRDNADNHEYHIGIEEAEKSGRLWTIQDAKEGDVLFHSDSASNGIFIFKEIIDKGFAKEVICYCDYDSEDHFCLGEHHTCCWTDAKILYPATKEQRDTLFAKMKEAGYAFDFEKKELKKLGQSEVTKTSDQEIGIAKIPFGAKDSELQEATYYIPKGFHAEIDDDKIVIKKGEKPTAWSEENGRRIQRISDFIWKNRKGDTDDIYQQEQDVKWLKSLKDRVGCEANCTTTKEWSEEDEHRVKDAIYFLDTAKKHYASTVELDACIDWLKSLKQRIGG